ncbi:MAG: hypothetical protein WD872_14385 [Pirellulaceae bacterium]
MEAADEGAAYIAQALFLNKNGRGESELPAAIWNMVAYFKKYKGFKNLQTDGRDIAKAFLRFLKSMRHSESGKIIYDLHGVRDYKGF